MKRITILAALLLPCAAQAQDGGPPDGALDDVAVTLQDSALGGVLAPLLADADGAPARSDDAPAPRRRDPLGRDRGARRRPDHVRAPRQRRPRAARVVVPRPGAGGGAPPAFRLRRARGRGAHDHRAPGAARGRDGADRADRRAHAGVRAREDELAARDAADEPARGEPGADARARPRHLLARGALPAEALRGRRLARAPRGRARGGAGQRDEAPRGRALLRDDPRLRPTRATTTCARPTSTPSCRTTRRSPARPSSRRRRRRSRTRSTCWAKRTSCVRRRSSTARSRS